MAAVCVFVLAAAFSGCGASDGEGRIFSYDISGNPDTLDPQQANEPNSYTVIENMFLGLTVIEQDGSVRNGAAESYKVSEDGLTYEFTLRRDIYWIDAGGFERQCTAKDFVFGFQRLFLPETEAPRAKDYYCIKNSHRIKSGLILDPSKLGVKANSDFELVITLETPNPRFLSMLAEPPAMPCNEEYFKNAQGKYGLSAECTPSNGSFYLKSWVYDAYNNPDVNNLILGRNDKNAETQTICPSGLDFFIRDEDFFISDFKSGETNCIALTNNERSQLKGSYNVYEFSNITCGLAFNSKSELFKNENFRRVLCMLIDRNAVISALPEYDIAQGIVPRQVTMLGEDYRNIAGNVVIPDYNLTAAKDLFNSIGSQVDKTLLTGAKVIVPDIAAQTAVSYIMQEWQRELGFYCKVETLSEREYAKALSEGDFDIAMLEISGKYNSPAAYLEKFSAASTENYTGFSNAEAEDYLRRAAAAVDNKQSASLYLKAEQALIDRLIFFPLYYKNEYFFTSSKSRDIIYNPFSKTVNFTLAKM